MTRVGHRPLKIYIYVAAAGHVPYSFAASILSEFQSISGYGGNRRTRRCRIQGSLWQTTQSYWLRSPYTVLVLARAQARSRQLPPIRVVRCLPNSIVRELARLLIPIC